MNAGGLRATPRDRTTDRVAGSRRTGELWPQDGPAETVGTPRSIGVEEEFHLVDKVTRRLTPRAPELLDHLTDACYVAEMQKCVIETNTDVTSNLSELREELLSRRARLIEAADRLGLGVVAAGSVPLAVPGELTLTETPRFRRMLSDYQLLAEEQLICGTQVHVEIPDRDEAVAVGERITLHLPTLLALSASSPFWADGSDTGYASVRTLVWSRWPTTGLSSGVADAAGFDAMVDDLIASGVITDPGMMYFDVRPSQWVPTLELRICDSCPLVDTIVLVAGLFRALVERALAEHREGRPTVSIAPALGRAASWRAARSGLEGDLVDLQTRVSRPAADVVSDLVAGLESQLRHNGDWEAITALADTILLAGSSAARQRRVYRRRGRLTDVVDVLIAETASPHPARQDLPSAALLEGYSATSVTAAEQSANAAPAPAPVNFDEAIAADGTSLPGYREIIQRLTELGSPALRHRWAGIENQGRADGITFRTADRVARVFPVDVVPRIISAADWEHISAGAAQRARALDLFIRDVYGPKAILEDGLVPAQMLDRAPGFRSSGRLGGRSVRAQVCGLDLVQDAPGHWVVLEDNLRIPSGSAYALSNRELMARFLPGLGAGLGVAPIERVPAQLLETLRASAPARCREDPQVALLSSGPGDSAYAEHRQLATLMGVPIVRPQDLTISVDGVRMSVRGRDHPVHVLYVRMDEDMLLSSTGADRLQLRIGLVGALHRAQVTLANGLGNGVGDDKAVYAYVPAMIDYYLGEKPLLDAVPTYLCAERDQRDYVLAHLDRLVTKPIDGYGGSGVLIGPEAGERQLTERRRDLIIHPERFIGQDLVKLSTHPTFDGTGLHPRHVDLRVFVHLRPGPRPRSTSQAATAVVTHAPLTRVGPAGTSIVNSSAGGSSKDTWILTGDDKD